MRSRRITGEMASFNGAGSQTYGGDGADTIATQSGSIGYGGDADDYIEGSYRRSGGCGDDFNTGISPHFPSNTAAVMTGRAGTDTCKINVLASRNIASPFVALTRARTA